ncbi:MAG: LacI family DNA-binding transcriptional regulator [Acidimicrobiia bacterium]|nr:LacI family DNA-binding transcriptional regulator [Acidimicrobiia bacterium]
MVTIADVAATAGVGAGTVSRVLNDRPKVSPSTRARVLAAIEELEYRPNPLARGLSLGRCQTLGVVVPFFTHASAVERLRGIVAALRDSRYDLVLFNVESPVHRDEHFEALTRRDRADGLLVLSLPPPPDHLARLRAAGVPIVLVDATAPGVPCVVTDDVEGGRIATRHLLSLGHRDIAFIGDSTANGFGFTSSARREEGYGQVLRAAGIRVRRSYVRHGAHERDVAARLAGQLLRLRVRPTAVFASSDVQATGVLAAARSHGLRVPEDLSVVGFDDIEISAYAGLTTVRQPLFDSGYLGARHLLDALEGGTPIMAAEHHLPLELVVRLTTTKPRSGARG